MNQFENFGIFKYKGSKTRELDLIYKYLPISKIDFYVDVFGGSGVVSFFLKTKFNNKKIIYNDFDTCLVKLLINLRNPNFLKIAINNLENFSTEKLRFILRNVKENQGKIKYRIRSKNLYIYPVVSKGK
jgi:site-specific DNA-adenine methylase